MKRNNPLTSKMSQKLTAFETFLYKKVKFTKKVDIFIKLCRQEWKIMVK